MPWEVNQEGQPTKPKNLPIEDQKFWIRRSTKVHKQSQRFMPSMDFALLTNEGVPSYYEEAWKWDDSKLWELAMEEEMM